MKERYEQQHRYDDIIHLPHHVSAVHPPMSMWERAAQFSPFSALTGHQDAIKEAGRYTEEKRELSSSAKEMLDRTLQQIQSCIQHHPVITVTYFVADDKKAGGTYKSTTGSVNKIDFYGRFLIMDHGLSVSVDDIFDISLEDSYPISAPLPEPL